MAMGLRQLLLSADFRRASADTQASQDRLRHRHLRRPECRRELSPLPEFFTEYTDEGEPRVRHGVLIIEGH